MTTLATRRTVGSLACAALLVTIMGAEQAGQAPAAPRFPDIAGIWNGGARARPINSEVYPWTEANFPDTPGTVKLIGTVSLLSWLAVLYCGRMLPFLGDAF
jgi:hypothetical protein